MRRLSGSDYSPSKPRRDRDWLPPPVPSRDSPDEYRPSGYGPSGDRSSDRQYDSYTPGYHRRGYNRHDSHRRDKYRGDRYTADKYTTDSYRPRYDRHRYDRSRYDRPSENRYRKYQHKSPPKHNILTIPPELFDNIARHARPRDLCQLRLVSKKCAARVLKVYTEVHFTERSFLLYGDSMRTLVDTARSEYFGKQLKKIVLCVDELPDATVEDIPRADMEEAIALLTEFGGPVARRNAEYMRQNGLHLVGRDVRLHHKDEDFVQGWEMLQDALVQLRRLGNTPAVQVTTADLLARKPRMYKTFSNEARSELAVKPETNERNFDMLMSVIVDAGILITELDMCPGEMDWRKWGEAFGVPLYTALRHEEVKIVRNDVASVFKHLRKLKINMGELEEHTRENDKNRETDFARMAEAFAGMDALEELVLRQDARNAGFDPILWLGKPFLALSFPSLRDLTLDGWEIDLRNLPAFLSRQTRLERVRLSLCELTYAAAHPAE